MNFYFNPGFLSSSLATRNITIEGTANFGNQSTNPPNYQGSSCTNPSHVAGCKSKTVTLIKKRQPDFMGVPVAYNFGGVARPAPSVHTIRPGRADAALWAMWPFPDASGGSGGYRVGGAMRWSQSAINPGTGIDVTQQLAVHQCKMGDNQPDYIYGFFGSPHPFIDHIGGAPPRRAHQAYGNTESALFQGTYAHELGHNFSFDDEDGVSAEVGVDVMWRILGNRIKPESYIRIMDGSLESGEDTSTTWINIRGSGGLESGGYEELLNNEESYAPFSIIGVCNRAVPGTAQPIRIITGRVPADPLLPATIGPTLVITDTFSTSSGAGNATLRARDHAGNELYSTSFDATAPGDDFFLAFFPATPSDHVIELTRDGMLQDVITATASAPTLMVTMPVSGQTITETLHIAWIADDADGDLLTAEVSYEVLGLNYVQPLTFTTDAAEISVDTTALPAGERASIVVSVSDGFDTTTKRIDNLIMGPNRPASAYISSPADGIEVLHGVNIVLSSSAYDPEDGWLTGSALEWESDIDSLLGTGGLINISTLSVGQHTITLRATDSAGTEATDSVVVTVTN